MTTRKINVNKYNKKILKKFLEKKKLIRNTIIN